MSGPSKLAAAAMALLLAVSQATAMAAPRSDLGDRLREESSDYQRTVSEGTALGALLGAAIGGAIGASQGRGGGGALGGAFLGAILGGAVGNAGGRAVAGEKAAYAAREDELDQAIAKARAGNRRLAALSATAGRLVAARRAELARLDKAGGDDGSRQRLASDLGEEVAALDQSLATARTTRDTLRSNAANFSGRAGGALAGEAKQTSTQIGVLEQRRNELARMKEGLSR